MAVKNHIFPDDQRTYAACSNGRRGIFVTFEGGDGAGKTTHIGFLAEVLRSRGEEVVCLREPGGTTVGEALRSIVLDPTNEQLSDEAELLVYEAARAQLVAEVVEPALARGAVVLCDRFTDSTLAYQGFGRGIERGLIERLNAFACRGLVPDRTILIVCERDDEVCAPSVPDDEADRLERAGAAFHGRVNEGFRELARRNPERFRVVASAPRRADTARAVLSALEDLFPWMGDALADASLFAPLEQRDAQEAIERG